VKQQCQSIVFSNHVPEPPGAATTMQRSILSIVLMLALVNVSLCSGKFGTNALTSTTTRSIADVLKAYTSSFSCSSSSATSYGGIAIAYSQSNSKSIIAAASSCANAVANAFGTAGSGCYASDVSASVSAAAYACASSSIALRTSSVASAQSKGRAFATANACGYSTAYSVTYAKAIAKAVGDALAKGCGDQITANAQAKVTAVATALTRGLAGSWAYAATFGNGKSKATSTALFTADVAVYAQAVGKLLATACSQCGSKCALCAKIEDGDDTYTDSLAIAAKGRVALASAFSDAQSAVCQKAISVEAATQGCLRAVGEVCVQIFAKATGSASASGNAVACTSSYATGKAVGLSKAFGSLVAEASALAFKSDECAANAWSKVTADVFVNLKVEEIVKASQTACVRSKGKTVTFAAIASALKLSDNKTYANAVSDALASVVTSCECSGNGWCCNCGLKSEQCPY
jgi:hypothetical protein